MKIYCMSDIHGCLAEFEEALSLVIEHLEEPGTMLCLMGDYVHGGADNQGVLDKIIHLQNQYGSGKVLALMGNHEEFVRYGYSTINHMSKTLDEENSVDESEEDKYIQYMKNIQLKQVSTSIG